MDGDTANFESTDRTISSKIIHERNHCEDEKQHFDNDVDRIFYKLSLLPSFLKFPDLMKKCNPIIHLWYETFSSIDPKLWKRMKRNIPKELNESAFILNEVMRICQQPGITKLGDEEDNECKGPITIIDVCSGIGFLSMFLSHLLPPEKISLIFAVDILFPHHSSSSQTSSRTAADDKDDINVERQKENRKKTNHLSTSHLLDPIHPIPIRPRKANIKKGRELRQITKYCIAPAPGPVIILGIHLCKSLSVHTVRLFHSSTDNQTSMFLKPCCLPGRRDLSRREPPFWTFDGMQGGGFGIKSLYCEEINRPGSKDNLKAKHEAHTLELANRDARLASKVEEKQDVHTSDKQSNPLFTRWVGLLCDAANSETGVNANINLTTVQVNHFQNQYIVATRGTSSD